MVQTIVWHSKLDPDMYGRLRAQVERIRYMPFTKLRILTDRITGQERRVSLRAMIALSSLPLFGMVAAFGLAPDTNTLNISTQTVIENIEIPKIVASASSNDFQREEQVQSGDTLASVLARLKIDELDIQRLLSTEVAKQGARRLKAGNRIQATTSANGQLAELVFANAEGGALRIVRQGENFVSQQPGDVLETRVIMRFEHIARLLADEVFALTHDTQCAAFGIGKNQFRQLTICCCCGLYAISSFKATRALLGDLRA